MENILIITLSIINILLFLPFLIINRKNKYYNNLFNHTIGFAKNVLGFIVSINGDIRLGKTSLMSGLSSVYQLIIMGNVQDLITKTRNIFKNYDFNIIDNTIFEYFENFSLDNKDEYPDFDFITDYIIEIYDIDPLAYVNNFIGNSNSKHLLLDYTQALFVFYIRNNYVQSKTPFYSHITGNYNYELDTEWLKIRLAYQNKDYAINDWMVILIDEITDEAGASEWQTDVKDLAGAKEYRRKFGQIHQERNFIITTKQDVMDEVKKYRNLTHSHLSLDDRVRLTGNYYWIHSFISRVLSIKLFFHKNIFLRLKFLFMKNKEKGFTFNNYYEMYEKQTNIIRNTNNYLFYLKEFLTSIGYNVYYGRNLKRAEDIEKVKADVEEFYFYIPTMLCFGTYDTHLYKSMQTDIIRDSTTIAKEIIPELNPKFFEESKTITKGDDSFDFN